jgi:hypothetical protein
MFYPEESFDPTNSMSSMMSQIALGGRTRTTSAPGNANGLLPIRMNNWSRKRCKVLVPRDGSHTVNRSQLAQAVENGRSSVLKLARHLVEVSERKNEALSAAGLVEKLEKGLELENDFQGKENDNVNYEPPIEDEMLRDIVRALVLDAPLRMHPDEDEIDGMGSWQDTTVDILADGLIQMLDESHKMQLLDRIMVKSMTSPPRLSHRKEDDERDTSVDQRKQEGARREAPQVSSHRGQLSNSVSLMNLGAQQSNNFKKPSLDRAVSAKALNGVDRRPRSHSSEVFSSTKKTMQRPRSCGTSKPRPQKNDEKWQKNLEDALKKKPQNHLPGTRSRPNLSKESLILARNISFGGNDETWRALTKCYNKIRDPDTRLKYLKAAARMSVEQKNETLEILGMIEDDYVEIGLRIISMGLGFEKSVEVIDAIKENDRNTDYNFWKTLVPKSDEEFASFINMLLLM